jgi:hypothetical protein
MSHHLSHQTHTSTWHSDKASCCGLPAAAAAAARLLPPLLPALPLLLLEQLVLGSWGLECRQ